MRKVPGLVAVLKWKEGNEMKLLTKEVLSRSV
jgi:hypothetical protein